MVLKSLVVGLLVIGALLKFIKVERKSRRVGLRKDDITAYLSGTIFALIAVLIWLFG